MTTLLFLFLIALGFALVLTPAAKWLGVRLGVVDVPMERKVHTTPIPRSGGVAVFLAFTATMSLTNLFVTNVSELFTFDHRTAFGFYGALVVFGCGLWDDFRRLNPWVKLLFQIAGASLAFAGGVSIGGIFLDWHGIQFGILSYAVTVFWFLLFINAVNLIDGLDGLAGGVVFFTCLLMVILSVMAGNFLNAMYFAALGGAVLGFLRYNFNPASIFLGDGGSYFLGYAVAALSIVGSVKSQVGALMLIPLLALGVPVFDTIFAPLRRWVKGRRMFQPDRGHIHHRLLAMGLSSRKAVLILYGVTLALCLLAILIVNLRNEAVGLILILLGGGALILVRKTGYLEYLAFDKFYGWFKDMTDMAGLSRERRTFLAVQMEANKAHTLEEMLATIGDALEMLRFDRAELHLKNRAEINRDSAHFSGNPSAVPYAEPDRRKNGGAASPKINRDSALFSGNSSAVPFDGTDQINRDSALFSEGGTGDNPGGAAKPGSGGNPGIGAKPPAATSTKIFEDIREGEDGTAWVWTRGYYRRLTDIQKEEMLKIDLPLHGNGNGARLILMKDLGRDPLQYYTLRRLEHLRRTLRHNLTRLQK